ncbi:MAG: hypothetical protein RLZ98_1451 [Pseudomonadota bacterium]|jgi:NAD(P)-dependent dehydrogenase (short-subunit alcohol dehydrogenase family)
MAGGQLDGRRILVTGGASGIGKATVELFASEGAAVAVLDIDGDAADAVAGRIGGRSFQGDVSDEASVLAAVNAAAQALDGLDGLVCAAGVGQRSTLSELDNAEWQRIIGVNLSGTYLVCRAALPHLQEAPVATIVNVSSGAATRPGPTRSAYAASKAGVVAFTRAIALELGPNIRVNAILPGAADTPLMRNMLSTPEARQAAAARYALKRIAEPAEIANAILFLTSGQSSFVNGSPLIIDGGQ